MRKLTAVQDARAVMTEGMEWSAWRWLLEKQRVREIADRATAALDTAHEKVKSTWPADLKTAYAELVSPNQRTKRKSRSNHAEEPIYTIGRDIRLVAKQMKEADDRAERCRLDAEDMFDEAEQRFSAEMAREGARKALETYDLREAAIRTSEAAARERCPVVNTPPNKCSRRSPGC